MKYVILFYNWDCSNSDIGSSLVSLKCSIEKNLRIAPVAVMILAHNCLSLFVQLWVFPFSPNNYAYSHNVSSMLYYRHIPTYNCDKPTKWSCAQLYFLKLWRWKLAIRVWTIGRMEELYFLLPPFGGMNPSGKYRINSRFLASPAIDVHKISLGASWAEFVLYMCSPMNLTLLRPVLKLLKNGQI